MRTFVKTVLWLLWGLSASVMFYGCATKAPHYCPVQPRFPVISMRDVYPDGQTSEDFWAEEQTFLEDYRRGVEAGMVTEGEQEVMRHLLRRDVVRRASEEKIREYNRYAREINKLNGYQ